MMYAFLIYVQILTNLSSSQSASVWFETNKFLLSEDKTQNVFFTYEATEANFAPNNHINEVKYLCLKYSI